MDLQVGIAEVVRVGVNHARGIATVYKLDPPLQGNEYVVVSAIDASLDPSIKYIQDMILASGIQPLPVVESGNLYQETSIFASNAEGVVTVYEELPGTVRGTMNHVIALQRAGYEVKK